MALIGKVPYSLGLFGALPIKFLLEVEAKCIESRETSD
jgi:hypothetical protein